MRNVGIEIDEIKGLAEGLITKDVLSRKQEYKNYCIKRRKPYSRCKPIDILSVFKHKHCKCFRLDKQFPQIFLIPRSSRQVYDLVEMFNDEYISREEEVDFSNLKVPKGCEIMGYVI